MQAVRSLARFPHLRRCLLPAASARPAAAVSATAADARGTLRGAWQPQHVQQQRWFASKDQESDDDFKPQRKAVPQGDADIKKMIEDQVREHKLMVYMKGTPSAPQCGFSMQVVRILHAQGVPFSSVNVLDYPAIRDGIKKFSDWPTIPQVYLEGEFVGGCDIMTQLHKSGELETMLKDAGLMQAAAAK